MISLGVGVGGLVGHLGVVRLVHVGVMVVYIYVFCRSFVYMRKMYFFRMINDK